MTRTILLALLPLAACGQGAGAPDVAVSDAWARETRTGSTAAYMTIINRGTGADRLVAIAAAPPVGASIHETSNDGGISRMRPLDDGLEVPAQGKVTMRPGGVHVMLMGIDGPLTPGERLPLALRFERSGERRISVEARAALPAS